MCFTGTTREDATVCSQERTGILLKGSLYSENVREELATANMVKICEVTRRHERRMRTGALQVAEKM